jgi:hypothetical protein
MRQSTVGLCHFFTEGLRCHWPTTSKSTERESGRAITLWIDFDEIKTRLPQNLEESRT